MVYIVQENDYNYTKLLSIHHTLKSAIKAASIYEYTYNIPCHITYMEPEDDIEVTEVCTYDTEYRLGFHELPEDVQEQVSLKRKIEETSRLKYEEQLQRDQKRREEENYIKFIQAGGDKLISVLDELSNSNPKVKYGNVTIDEFHEQKEHYKKLEKECKKVLADSRKLNPDDTLFRLDHLEVYFRKKYLSV